MMILATNVYDAMVIFLENTKKLNTFAASVWTYHTLKSHIEPLFSHNFTIP